MIKIRIKPLLIALALTGLSSPVFANNMVTVPNLDGGFMVGLSGLYFVPGPVANTVYGAYVNNTLIANLRIGEQLVPSTTQILGGPAEYVHSLEAAPNYSWGFALQLGYVFPCTGNDVILNWNHLNTSKTAEVIGGGLNRNLNISISDIGIINANRSGTYIIPFVGSVNPLRGISPELGNMAPYSAAFGRSSTQWSSVDLSFGQHLNIGGNFDLRMAAGLVWARINNELEAVYTGSATNITTQTFGGGQGTTVQLTQTDLQNSITWMNEESTFRGFGPEIGFDGHYCITNTNFGLTGHLGGQMLIGTVDTDLCYATANTGQQSLATTTTGVVVQSSNDIVGRNADYLSNYVSDSQNDRLVPEIDAKLGIDYTYHFMNHCACDGRSTFVVEFGYQAAKYFNALRAFDRIGGNINTFANFIPDAPMPAVIPNPPVSVTSLRSEDAFFHGPYLTVKFFA